MHESDLQRYEYIIEKVAVALAKQDGYVWAKFEQDKVDWRDVYRKQAEVAIDTIREAGWML